jgi:citrate synthase
LVADMLDSEEAARHLGVKLPTLYAYVSRGLVVSHPVPGSRRRRFAREDLDRLAGRSRPSGVDDTRLATVVTGVTHLEADGPRYRGRRVQDMLGQLSFEEVADLLWRAGDSGVPGAGGGGAVGAVGGSGVARAAGAGGGVGGSGVPWEGVVLSDPTSPTSPLGDGDLIRYAVVAAGAGDPFRGDRRHIALVAAARRLIATVVDVLPVRSGGKRPPPLMVAEEPRPGSIAARLAAALGTRPANPDQVAALDVAMVVMADHELATATVAARVAASARADIYGVVLSAMGAMSGRLHGAASNEVRPLLDDARWHGPAEALGRVLRERPVPAGFGHGLYDGGDPRARWLLQRVQMVASPEQWRVIAELLAVAEQQGIAPPNVDFGLGALAWATAMVPGASETIATVARIAGWVAHAMEEYDEAPLRFRARAVYRSEP